MFALSALRMGLWKQSMVRCADNTGIIKGVIIGLGENKWGTGKVGDKIRVSVRDKHEWYKGEQLPKSIIARRRKETKRKDGSYIKFDDNAFIVIQRNKSKGNKIKGPLPYEISNNCKALARPWLSSDFAKDLERDSLRLFRLAEESTWFDTRHFVAALLAVTPPGESSLSRALQLLRFPPCFLPLPPPAACNSFVDAGEEGGWVCLTLPCQPYPDAAMAKELQRQWSSAFLTDDRTANAAARSLCVDVLCRWRALWSVARCARDPANAPRATRTDYVFRRSSLRGTEWWKVSILDLSIGSAAKARADFGGVNPSGSIAAVCLAYWEKRLMG